jgi:hypothetical protein
VGPENCDALRTCPGGRYAAREGGLKMIRLRFNSLAGTDPAILGPAPFFRIAGPVLQQGPDRTVVGRYFDHHWEIGSRFVSSYECVEAARLHFVGPGGTSVIHGPFQQVRFPNGSCYADRSLFGELVQDDDAGAGQWVHCASLVRWQVLVISPA